MQEVGVLMRHYDGKIACYKSIIGQEKGVKYVRS